MNSERQTALNWWNALTHIDKQYYSQQKYVDNISVPEIQRLWKKFG